MNQQIRDEMVDPGAQTTGQSSRRGRRGRKGDDSVDILASRVASKGITEALYA